jgi:mannose-6-phosphate isomerase-like protein (cupin superfamily)
MQPMISNATNASSARYRVAQLDEIPAVACPCGQTRRAFVADDNPVATIHMVDISADSRPHFHKKLTEIYLVLEGEGHMELDGDIVLLKPLTTVLIQPGCRHRAVGNLRIVNIPVPAFDPTDEHF